MSTTPKKTRSRVDQEGLSNPDYAGAQGITPMSDDEELMADTAASDTHFGEYNTDTDDRSFQALTRADEDANAYETPAQNVGNPAPSVPAGDDDPSIAEARAQIEETRAHLSETIDAIKDKLSPAHLMEEAKEATIGKAQDAVSGVVDAVKGKASAVVDGVKDAYHAASDKISDIADRVTHRGDAPAYSGAAPGTPSYYGGDSYVSGTDYSTGQKNKGAMLVDTIKMNPVPAAIAGFGLGWLLLSMRRQSQTTYYSGRVDTNTGDNSYDTPASYAAGTYGGASNQFDTAANSGPSLKDRASDVVSGVSDKASDIAHNVGDKASDIAHSVADRASDIKNRASGWAGSVADRAGDLKDRAGDSVNNLAAQGKQQAQAATDSVDTFIHENPLAAGAIALLIGAAVGFAFPATDVENRWVGDKRDRVLDQATDAVKDVATKVQNVAGVAMNQAKDSLSQTVDQAKQQLHDVVDKTKDTVMNEAQHQGLTSAPAAGTPA